MNQTETIIAAVRETGRILCPECAHERKRHPNQPTMSVTVESDRNVYLCHHCGFSGCIPFNDPPPYKAPKQKITPIPTQKTKEQETIVTFFGKRGVTLTDLSGIPLMTTGVKFFHGPGEVDAIGFVYGTKEHPTAIKWRPLDLKAFTQDGVARDFYGLEQLPKEPDTLIIVEGEADVIALASIGIKALSCPNGAPIKVNRGLVSPEEDNKFAYVWDSRDLLDGATRIVLATDQDEPGQALAEELARRVGRAKCWRTLYPAGCKDLTDVLAQHGAEAVHAALKQSAPMPLEGVYAANDYDAELMDIYENGHGKGESTGLPRIDRLFTIKEGQLSVVTGLPCSGKSEFVDQIMVNLAKNSSWKFAVASFENPPATHISKLAEKVIGKPFYKGRTARMSRDEVYEARRFINDHFVFLESKDGSMATVDSIIDRTKQAVMRLGVRGLVIDPYNYIQMDGEEGEHKAISDMLSKITSFAKAHGIHIWFVAHPAKMYPKEDGTYPVPKGMSISGSAAWFAKADVGVTVHRGAQSVEIHCWKVRFKWVGEQGIEYLGYDVPTGRYFEGDEEQFKVPLAYKKGAKKGPGWHTFDVSQLEF